MAGFNSLEKLEQKAAEATKKLAATEKELGELTVELIAVSVRHLVRRAEEILDQLVIDSLDRTPKLLFELTSIEATLKAQEPGKNFVELGRQRANMLLVIVSLKQYKDDHFDAVDTTLQSLPDNVIHKHRILTAALHKLYVHAEKAGRDAKMASLLPRIRAAAEKYSIMALATNRKIYISKVNLANAHILAKDFELARKTLKEAIKAQPQSPTAYYNLAALETRAGSDLHEALKFLRAAKERGEITTAEDIDYFRSDPDFKRLHQSADRKIKDAVKALIGD